jgi:hypothetical protein
LLSSKELSLPLPGFRISLQCTSEGRPPSRNKIEYRYTPSCLRDVNKEKLTFNLLLLNFYIISTYPVKISRLVIEFPFSRLNSPIFQRNAMTCSSYAMTCARYGRTCAIYAMMCARYLCQVSGFRCSALEAFTFVGQYATWDGSRYLPFGKIYPCHLQVSSISKRIIHVLLGLLDL